MKELIKKIEENYLLGCIRHNEVFNIYLMPIAWWILNYSKYDPKYNSADWGSVFRDNIYNVDDDKVDKFIQSVEVDKVDINDLKPLIEYFSAEDKNEDEAIDVELYFFIDFDNKLFINGFTDVEIEKYLPDESWRGEVDSPINYLPKEMKILFSK